MKRTEKDETSRDANFIESGKSGRVSQSRRTTVSPSSSETPSPSPPQSPPEIRPDRTFQPRPKSPHVPDMPDDPTRERPSVPSEPPPEIGPSKNPPPIGPPPAERKPFFNLMPIVGGVVGFQYGFEPFYEYEDIYIDDDMSSPAPLRTWDRKRLMIILFTPKRRFE